jgi:hypothetical protein
MSGAIAANLHEGSRSEILADYLFSSWGPVTPVRRQDDFGIDLYCTLTERIGQKARVRDYYSVQVKSEEDTWKLKDGDAVKWLVEHPTPLFLCMVSKKESRVRIYHVFPRFYLWAIGTLPSYLELNPGIGSSGSFTQWENGSSFSLSAPVIEVGLDDLIDKDRMEKLRDVFSCWVQLDRENCDRVRQGLRRFRMPDAYEVNALPKTGFGEVTLGLPEARFLKPGLLRLAEALECIGGQLGQSGDREFALEAALLLDQIQSKHPELFEGNPFWRHRVPGELNQVVVIPLNKALGDTPSYHYAGFDTVKKNLWNDPLIRKYLEM